MDKRFIVLMTLILTIVGLILLMHSSYFGVKAIRVIGNERMTKEEVIEASGVSKGLNLFLLPGREVANRLMNYVRIKGVKLERDFPDTLVIHVNERNGLALFQNGSGKWMELSGDGMILEVYAAGMARPDLPIVEGMVPKIVDKQVELNENLEIMLALLKKVYPWRKEITKVSYKMEDVHLAFDSGTIIYFGHVADVEKNLPVFETIWNNIQNPAKKIQYIDLRYSGKPVIRER